MVGLGLLATTIGVVAYVGYRQRETRSLRRDVELARSLRELAGTDDVRLAAVEEFEVGIYQRLFYASVIGPRARSAAWALLGCVLSVAGVLVTGRFPGVVGTSAHIAVGILAVVFGVVTVVFVVMALYHAATTPRVSFAESYGAQSSGTEPSSRVDPAEQPD